jgi:G3E family GTPase
VIVTKADLAPSRIDALRGAVTSINGAAPITITVPGGGAPPSILTGNLISDLHGRSLDLPMVHSRDIASFVLTFDRPLNWPSFALAMRTLAALRGPDLLRAKGLLAVEGTAGPVVVHYVQHLAHPPAELKAWPGSGRASRMVFITRNIGRQAVADLFAAIKRLQCPAEEGEQP